MNTLYLYNVVAEYDDCEIVTKTNSVDIACGEFNRYYGDSKCVYIMDTTTGEILADWNVESGFSSNLEWRYIFIGWAITHAI